MDAFESIKKQQEKAGEGTAAYCVGLQLADMLRAEPELAEIVEKDIDAPGMGIAECEKKIKELADKRHKENKGSFAFVSPTEAEEIIRKFYGLPESGNSLRPVRGTPLKKGGETADWMDELL